LIPVKPIHSFRDVLQADTYNTGKDKENLYRDVGLLRNAKGEVDVKHIHVCMYVLYVCIVRRLFCAQDLKCMYVCTIIFSCVSVAEGHPAESLLLEIKGLKFAQNKVIVVSVVGDMFAWQMPYTYDDDNRVSPSVSRASCRRSSASPYRRVAAAAAVR
jgi:hypothetical protein